MDVFLPSPSQPVDGDDGRERDRGLMGSDGARD